MFIGDSRTVQMYAFLTSDWSGANYSSGGIHEVKDSIFVAEGGQGLDWLKSIGIPAAKNYFSSGAKIVILMGVNDLYNVDEYIKYFNSNINSWTSNGSKVYYSAVTPCNGSYENLNASIISFNSKLKSNISSKIVWIDSDNNLNSSGFKTTDGLHYDQDTSNKIYNYIKNKV